LTFQSSIPNGPNGQGDSNSVVPAATVAGPIVTPPLLGGGRCPLFATPLSVLAQEEKAIAMLSTIPPMTIEKRLRIGFGI
jgi:hypothetical protein